MFRSQGQVVTSATENSAMRADSMIRTRRQPAYCGLPSRIAVMGQTSTDAAAGAELQRGLSSMLGRSFTLLSPAESLSADSASAIVIASAAGVNNIVGEHRPVAARRQHRSRRTRRLDDRDEHAPEP